MNIEELKTKIKPELESVFGGAMTNLILTKAKMRVSTEAKDIDDKTRNKIFVESLGNDERVVGMWGSLEVKEKIARWLNYID